MHKLRAGRAMYLAWKTFEYEYPRVIDTHPRVTLSGTSEPVHVISKGIQETLAIHPRVAQERSSSPRIVPWPVGWPCIHLLPYLL